MLVGELMHFEYKNTLIYLP